MKIRIKKIISSNFYFQIFKFLNWLIILNYAPLSAQINYFQQDVKYKIEVSLDDKAHSLDGFETVEYTNNSPDELSFLYFHLWPNAYKNNNTALAKQLLGNGTTRLQYALPVDRGYINKLKFKVNGDSVHWALDSINIDICKIYLNQPLKTGETISISTPFHVKIPKGIYSRMGHINQQYQITQWYPKPAVYDKNGWNQMPYLDQGEFYSEYGSYDVFITLPKNYVLGATGDLVDGENELVWLNQKAIETANKEKFKENEKTPKSDVETKTLHYHQENVHDFGWFCDKNYNVLKGEVELPHSKRKVATWAMFTSDNAQWWKKSIQYINDATYYYSLWNGDYPYNHVTAVDGALSAGGGMEYPNITVIGGAEDDFSLETVIMHEVGHNWFYGILGSNERVHAWMDEGINSFNENRYIETKLPDARLLGEFAKKKLAKSLDVDFYLHKAEYEFAYLYNACKNEDQPLELPSDKFTEFNYGGGVYSKTAIIFDYLMAYLGEELFDKCMQKYFDTWKFKHPQPEDIRKIFQETTGKNLSWFFDDLIKTTKKIDYKISGISSETNGFELNIKNSGQVVSPFSVTAIKNNIATQTLWYEGFQGTQKVNFPTDDYDKFKIDYLEDIPEMNRSNNTIKTKGLFKKAEPFKFQILGSLDNADKTQLFYSPIVGWNNYDKTMIGAAFYNNIIPQKKFEFIVAPMYSTNTNNISGYASFYYNLLPQKSPFKQITFALNTARFAYEKTSEFDFRYNKISPEITFDFRKKEARSTISHQLKLRSVNILQDREKPVFNDSGYYAYSTKTVFHYMVNNLIYSFRNDKTITPYNASLSTEFADKMIKSTLTANFKYRYKKNNKSIDVRFFGGAFLVDDYATTSSVNNLNAYQFRLSGKSPDVFYQQDYLFDEIFLGRSEYDGGWSQQMTNTDGAFKVYSVYGQTSKWMTTINAEIDFPGKIPLALFADVGSYDGIQNAPDFVDVTYDGGIALSLFNDVFKVYAPFIMSRDLKYEIEHPLYYDKPLSFLQTLRFQLNLKLVNPFKLAKNIQL